MKKEKIYATKHILYSKKPYLCSVIKKKKVLD